MAILVVPLGEWRMTAAILRSFAGWGGVAWRQRPWFLTAFAWDFAGFAPDVHFGGDSR